LSDELGGSFATVVMALLQDPEEFVIDCVHRAIAVSKRHFVALTKLYEETERKSPRHALSFTSLLNI